MKFTISEDGIAKLLYLALQRIDDESLALEKLRDVIRMVYESGYVNGLEAWRTKPQEPTP